MTATEDARPIVVAPYWADLNEHLCELLELIPANRLDEAPRGEWGARAVVHHIIGGRIHWLTHSLGRDGGEMPPPEASAEVLQASLRDSWVRVLAFLGDPAALEAEHRPPPHDPDYVDPDAFTGHYVAFHRLAHDINHRAQLIDRIRDLEIEAPADIRRRPLL